MDELILTALTIVVSAVAMLGFALEVDRRWKWKAEWADHAADVDDEKKPEHSRRLARSYGVRKGKKWHGKSWESLRGSLSHDSRFRQPIATTISGDSVRIALKASDGKWTFWEILLGFSGLVIDFYPIRIITKAYKTTR